MMGMFDTAPYVVGALSVGGVGVLTSRRRELIRRWWTWSLTASVMGGAMLLGHRGMTALALVLAVIATVEFGRLTRLPTLDRTVIAAALGGFILTADRKAWFVGVIAVAIAPVLAGDAADGARRSAYSLLGFAWLSALAGFASLGGAVLPIFIAVSVADVAAWCAGKALGGPKLTALSPNKTVAGLLGGALAALGVLALLDALTSILVIAVVAAAPVGDLFESMLKRGAGAKDAGTWLPGFGGLLDRLDSALLAFGVAMVLS